MEILEVQNLCKTYGKGEARVDALKDVSFVLEKGEFAAVVGESGSGKSTLLNCIGALDDPSSGSVTIEGHNLHTMKEEERTIFRRRNIGFIFQSFQLVSELTVEQNIVFPILLDYRKPNEQDVKEILDMLGLTERRNHLPNQLSGGQQQRVALARAIVIHPDVLLMDEPLCNLDAKLRVTMRTGIKKIQKQLNITTIYVTHDQEEALSISDRVAVIHDGTVEQVGEPKEIYTKPANMFVANFIGTSSFLDGTAKDGVVTIFGKKKLELPMKKDFEGNVKVSIRPEYVLLDEPKEGELLGTITLATFLGDFMNYEIQLENGQIIEINEYTDRMDTIRKAGDQISLNLMENRICIFDAQTEKSLMI